MPYTEYADQKESSRRHYVAKYSDNPAFAEAERERQRKLYEANRERIIARVLARRKELQSEKARATVKKKRK